MNSRCLWTMTACLFLLAPLTFAATFTVTTTSDGNCGDFNCNLHAALQAAQGNGQADTINIGEGTFSTAGTTFRYTSSENFGLTIDGADSGLTILDGGGTTQVLNLATADFELNNAPITIRDLTIRNGRNDFVILFQGVVGGGAHILTNYAPMEVTNCKFINNISDSDDPDRGAYGGAGFFEAKNADLTLTNNLFENNVARGVSAFGGGAYVKVHNANIALSNNVFRNNSAEGQNGVQGGGAVIDADRNVALVDNEFDGNTASAGAFAPHPDALWRGGAAFIYAPSFFGATTSVTLVGNAFQNNSCVGSFCMGGAIDLYTEAPQLSVTHNLFKNNSAVSTVVAGVGGGGAMLNTINELVLANNVFVNNSSDAPPGMSSYAGGVFLVAPTGGATVTNNTFASNVTDGEGGGVAIFAEPTDIYNNIFFNNTAALNGDDIFQYGGSFDFTMNLFNNILSELYSCQNTASCTPTINQGNNINADPLFVNAASGDFHLQATSPAVDAGTALAPGLPSTDLDGIIRIVGIAPDMGAFELNNLPPGSVFTPVGNNIPVAPGDPGSGITVNMIFQNVTQAGMSSLTTSTAGPVPPTGFKLGDPPTYYDLSTSALFTGTIDICIDYSNITFKNNAKAKLFHFEGTRWIDVTISNDTINKIVCGRVTSLSPFALFEEDGFNFTGFFSPVDNPPVLNVVKAGASVPLKFSLNGNQGLNIIESGYPKVQVIACSTSAAEDKLEETAKAGTNTLSYDAALDQYIYVWKTDKKWAGTCRRLEVKLVDGTSHFANFNFTR